MLKQGNEQTVCYNSIDRYCLLPSSHLETGSRALNHVAQINFSIDFTKLIFTKHEHPVRPLGCNI